jgi:cellulase/cellobiase CelA1
MDIKHSIRRLAVVAALATIGAIPVHAATAQAADPTPPCAGPVQITSVTFNPANIAPGQSSTLTMTAQNCTAQEQQASFFAYGRFFRGSDTGIPPGCPVIDPLPPRTVTIAPGATFTATQGYTTFASCTADRLVGTVSLTAGGVTANANATLLIAPVPTCAVTYRTTSSWAGGFVAQVTIAAIGTTPIQGWGLAFTFAGDQHITNAWNATTTQSGAAVTARNLEYNSNIAPGSSTTLGFMGTWHNSDAPPTAFTVNGAPCETR